MNADTEDFYDKDTKRSIEALASPESSKFLYKQPEGNSALSLHSKEAIQMSTREAGQFVHLEIKDQKLPVEIKPKNKKILAINPKRIAVSRSQSRLQEQGSSLMLSKNPSETPGSPSPIRLGRNQTPENDYLAEGDLLLRRGSSIPSPLPSSIRANGLLAFNSEEGRFLARTISKVSDFEDLTDENRIEILGGGGADHSFGPETPIVLGTGNKNRSSQILVVEPENLSISNRPKGTPGHPIFFQDEENKESYTSPSPIPNRMSVNRLSNASVTEDHRRPMERLGIVLEGDVNNDDEEGERESDGNNLESPNVNATRSLSQGNQAPNQNAGTTSNGILNNGTNPAQRSRAHPELTEPEINIHLRKTLAFFMVSTGVLALLLLIIAKLVPIWTLFIVINIYYIYLIIESAIGVSKREHAAAWLKKEDGLDTLDAIAALFGFIWWGLKLFNIVAYGIIATFPILLSVSFSSFRSSAPNSIRRAKTISHLMYLLQAGLLLLKLDKTVDWNYLYILLPSFVYLCAMIIYFAAYALFTLFLGIMVLFGQYTEQNLTIQNQFIGFIWYIMYYGLGLAYFFAIVGLVKAFEPGGTYGFLKTTLLISLVTNVCLVLYTCFMKKPLCLFVMFYSDREETDTMFDARRKQKIRFRVVKKASYFVMLSQTYFLPLNHELLAKNKENLQRIRKVLSFFKLVGPGHKQQQEKDAQHRDTGLITLETLHQFKENLDQTLDRVSKNDISSRRFHAKKHAKQKQQQIFSARVPDSKDTEEDELRSPGVKNMTLNPKLNLSTGDMENYKELDAYSKKGKPDDEDEDLCYLCYERPPNAVLMNCGHGGICYQCAISSNKVKNECVECRAPVVEIHKIDPNMKLTDMRRSLETSKVIVEDE